MPNSNEPIAKRLKKYREQSNLTIKEAAKLIGIPETTYREWEYGRAIRGEPYVKIARAFHITLDELFGTQKTSTDAVEKEIDKIVEELSQLKQRLIQLKIKRIS